MTSTRRSKEMPDTRRSKIHARALGVFAAALALATGVAPVGARPTAATKAAAAVDAPARRDAGDAFARLPMTFEANAGQTDACAKFVARGAAGTVFLTEGGAVLELRARERAGAEKIAPRAVALPDRVAPSY